MTREEEIKRASIMYHIYYYDYSYEEGETLDFYIKGFTEGANWADNNPPQDVVNLNDLWHQVTEEPVGKDWRILCEDKSDNCWVASRHCVFPIYFNWEEYALDKALTRWAYVSDLLPKGGEE